MIFISQHDRLSLRAHISRGKQTYTSLPIGCTYWEAMKLHDIWRPLVSQGRKMGVPHIMIRSSCRDLAHFTDNVHAFREACAMVRRTWLAHVLQDTPLGHYLESEEE